MSRNDLWKMLVLVFLAILSGLVVWPPTGKDGKIRYGLDLSGGTSFTVAIDEAKLRQGILDEDENQSAADVDAKVAAAMKDADARVVEVIRNRIDALGLTEPVIQSGKGHRITVQLPGINNEQRVAAEKSIQSAAFLEFRLVHPQNRAMLEKTFASKRVPDGYELTENGYTLKRSETYKEAAKDSEFARRLARFGGLFPRYEFMLLKKGRSTGGDELFEPVFVNRKAELKGDMLTNAEVDMDPLTGAWTVALKMNTEGARAFSKLTGTYAPKDPSQAEADPDSLTRLAIVLDGTLCSAPVIKEKIPNGRAQISGSFTGSEAAYLRNVLKAGSLPAPMTILEKRSVESTLGADAIRSGLRASVMGIALVALFMLVYYRYCGLIANVALLLDILLLPAGLVIASNVMGVFAKDSGLTKGAMDLPVLTMPGIAGIVLMLGMAVDANVLIFERMREEFALGKSAKTSVAAGYARAFLAIFDSNITTLLTAVILFVVGAGPIRGYAITLSAGIIISMFTALVVTRLIFNVTVPESRVKPYQMMQLLPNANFDFLKWGAKAGYTSLVVIVLTMAIFLGRAFTKPATVMSVDFTGGAAMTYSYEKRADIGEVRKAVAGVVNDATIQYQSSPDGTGNLLLVKTGTAKVGAENVSDILQGRFAKAFPESGFKLVGDDEVGSMVGKDLKRAAQWAILLSLVGILAYVSLRFEFGFALGAVVALAHDAFLTLGVYSLMGRQVSLTTVAALLTIVGYSVNDTIVVFDRIREDLRKDPKTDFKTLCKIAINRTLSRTILTSATTLLAALALFVFGGGAINDFALAMVIGLVVGTYSSIFIATPVMIAWYRGHRPGFATSK